MCDLDIHLIKCKMLHLRITHVLANFWWNILWNHETITSFSICIKKLLNTQVGWVKADTKAIQAIHDHVITHNPRVGVTHLDVNTWNLHIKAVTEEDRGELIFKKRFNFNINLFVYSSVGGYMCQINTDPMKSQVSTSPQFNIIFFVFHSKAHCHITIKKKFRNEIWDTKHIKNCEKFSADKLMIRNKQNSVSLSLSLWGMRSFLTTEWR